MAKRRVEEVETDDDDEPQTQTQTRKASGSKRARFDGGAPQTHEFEDDEERAERIERRKGKKRAEDEEMDEDDFEKPEDRPVDEAAETQFEEEHEEEIRESIRQRQKQQGGVAKFGIIEKVEMHQFMCHKYLTFNFGPQINFIIGHNGSGKSAVLSAITIALGGKANSTGRGAGLKSFIREGQGASEVTITLKNQGDEAYRHDVYGDSIVISRRFTKDGSSSYQIRSKSGQKVSSKREELSAICDHMNIQVDNPMNVLTQDAARQFLGSAHATDKYKFFLKGTQLSQLSEEYQTCMENVQRMQSIIETKRGAIDDLESAYKEASMRFKEAQTAREHRHKIDRLKKELAWAHVKTKEDELNAKVQSTARIEHNVERVQQALDTSQAAVERATEVVQQKEQAHAEVGNIEHLHAQDTEIKTKINGHKKKLQELKNNEQSVNGEVGSIRNQMEIIKKQKREEQAKNASYTEGTHEKLVARYEDAKSEVEAAEKTLQSAEALIIEKKAQRDAAREAGQQGDREKQAAEQNWHGASQQRENVERNVRDELAAFGNNLRGVIQTISRTRWHGNTPVGPLGQFVKVRDRQWSEVLRIQIGGMMSSWAVTDMRDRATLGKILKDSRNPHASIIVAEVDLFDYSAGEPDPRFLTILRALDISDEYVKRIMINQGRIERTMLFRGRGEADEALRGVHGGGMAVTQDLFRVMRYPDGGGSSIPLNKLRQNDQRHLMFTGRDSAAEIAHWREQEHLAEQAFQEVFTRIQPLLPAFKRLEAEVKNAQAAATRAHSDLAKARRKRDQLQEEVNNDVQLETAGLDDSLADLERDLEKMMAQFEPIVKEREEITAQVTELMNQHKEVKKGIAEFHDRLKAAQVEVEAAVLDRVQAQNNARHYMEKMAEEQKKLQDSREAEDVLREEFDNWSAKASEYCARVENTRKPDVIERELTGVQKALKEREKRDGATVEEMTVEVNRTHAALQKVKGELDELDELTLMLKKSVKTRVQKWLDFRRHIAFRCKVTFQYHLSNRGYFGKVIFDHINHTLDLKVQTDDVNATQGAPAGSRERDPRALSGGEKSFSTICLLLAMWESIGSPIRCLDEFDVFMDAVNRRISSKMIIDTANSSDGKQYILITPQSMDNIHIGHTVRVHRMSDPERGQGTLAYGNSVA
ncbi:P-loop containing nucleoside triphosphate hydrolase protein [Peniophora sp. CONT]|nr:P-loop containing nucleoside triphosphate hydrolase protein [Peniophora sp. CONT]